MMFGSDSTADEVLDGVDLAGHRVLVTGVSAGVGVETARALAARGAAVVGAVRDLGRGRTATAHVAADAAAAGSLELVELDLASLASVRRCADALLAAGARFDAVIANAGVMASPRGVTADGFETQFGTNHLGHFVLVNRIAGLFAPGGRLVMVSSAGHRGADVDLDDPNFERTPYDPLVAYRRSKTATILFAVEFDRRHAARGVRATSAHPGAVLTDTTRALITAQPAAAAAFAWKTVATGCRDDCVGGVRRPGRRGRRTLLRGVSRGRNGRGSGCLDRRPGLRRRSRAGAGALAPERGDGRRAVLIGRPDPIRRTCQPASQGL